MKFGLIVILALVASALAAHVLLQDPGYVVINFRNYLIEMSVPVLAAFIVAILIIAWMIRRLYRAPRVLGEAAGRYRRSRGGQKLTQGIIQLAEGNFSKGEKLLTRAADVSDAPLLNYLAAARAAHLQGQDDRRDTWLKEAYERLPEAANAVLLTQAELQLDQSQYEQALATLRQIEENTPNHSHALTLLGRLYYLLNDWDHLAELMPKLKKHGRLDDETVRKWALRVYQEQLTNASDGEVVLETWKKVPKSMRQDVGLLETYFESLMRTGQHAKAEKDLAADLKRDWRASLVRLYGVVEGPDKARQLKRAEDWLRDRGEDVDLLLTAARLCLRNELWGKARSYLETVIAIRPTPEAYQEFGRLLSRLGEGDAAADAYRAGLALVARSPLPAIPHLEPDAEA